MDIFNFDQEPANYRLESIIMFAISFMCIIFSFCLCMHNKQLMNDAPTEQQKKFLQKQRKDDISYRELDKRRLHLEQVKRMNRQMQRDMNSKRNYLIDMY